MSVPGLTGLIRTATLPAKLTLCDGPCGRIASTLEELGLVVNSDLMIVKGDAGVGKTHLLCDIAWRRLADGRPTVVLMGQQFTTTESPWIQARAQLDLLDLSAEQFVGALEAAAQAAGCRALFMIDAINEGEGHRIWKTSPQRSSHPSGSVSLDRRGAVGTYAVHQERRPG